MILEVFSNLNDAMVLHLMYQRALRLAELRTSSAMSNAVRSSAYAWLSLMSSFWGHGKPSYKNISYHS